MASTLLITQFKSGKILRNGTTWDGLLYAQRYFVAIVTEHMLNKKMFFFKVTVRKCGACSGNSTNTRYYVVADIRR